MRKKKSCKNTKQIAAIILLSILVLSLQEGAVLPVQAAQGGSSTAPSSQAAGGSSTAKGAGNAMSLVAKYDSADTAVLRAINTEAGTVQLFNHKRARSYTLNYDNTSMMTDAYGKALSAELLEAGTIVDVTFLKSTKHLNSLVINGDAFVLDDVSSESLDRDKRTIQTGDMTYQADAKTLIQDPDGRKISLSSILDGDVMQVSGIGDAAYVIQVVRGHGYLSLSSDKAGDLDMIGAWMEIGDNDIRKVTAGMLATVPEGSYPVRLSGNGFDYTDHVTIRRGQETVLDVSKIKPDPSQQGEVTFDVTPEDAVVRVDGKEADTQEPNTYLTGIHPLRVEAEGYTSLDAFLKVGKGASTVQLELEADGSVTGNDASSTSSSSSAQTSQNTGAASGRSSLASSSAASSSTNTDAGKGSTPQKNSDSTGWSNGSGSSKGNSSVLQNENRDRSQKRVGQLYIEKPENLKDLDEWTVLIDGEKIDSLPYLMDKPNRNNMLITLRRNGYKTINMLITVDPDDQQTNVISLTNLKPEKITSELDKNSQDEI